MNVDLHMLLTVMVDSFYFMRYKRKYVMKSVKNRISYDKY